MPKKGFAPIKSEFVPIESGFTHLLILSAFLLLMMVGGGIYFLKTNTGQNPQLAAQLDNITAKVNIAPPVNAQVATPSPTPTPILWKTYTNSKYQFQLTYPAQGMVLTKEGYREGECGQAIGEGTQQSNRIIPGPVQETIKMDNFFEIVVLNWPGTIDQYLESLGVKNKYDIFSFSSSGADEAIQVIGLKPGKEYAIGYPPLAYVNYIYKKEDNLFLIKGLYDPENYGGCIAPSQLDPAAHDHLKIKNWDIKQSLQFI
ncbi:MAG: hypothetical protein M1142_01015 [Patescibacteria group bacterium]|nr:hypothetical protein [Patescibacteria group bacterium]